MFFLIHYVQFYLPRIFYVSKCYSTTQKKKKHLHAPLLCSLFVSNFLHLVARAMVCSRENLRKKVLSHFSCRELKCEKRQRAQRAQYKRGRKSKEGSFLHPEALIAKVWPSEKLWNRPGQVRLELVAGRAHFFFCNGQTLFWCRRAKKTS
jgi:hypothetical protein